MFFFCLQLLLLSVPFSFPVSFVVSSVSSFLPPPSSSSFPFHFFLLALSSFPVFVFLFPRFLLSFLLPPAAHSLLSVAPTPPFLPTLLCSSHSFFGFLLLFFSFLLLSFLLFIPSFLLFLFSLLFSDPTVFSSVSSPLPSSSASWVVPFLRLFLLYRQFLPFLLFSFSCLFLSLACSSSFSPFSRALLSFLLGFASLSVFRFPFACFCVLAICGLIFFVSICFSFLSLPLLVSMFLRSVIHFLFLSASPLSLLLVFLCRLNSSTVWLFSASGSLCLGSTC